MTGARMTTFARIDAAGQVTQWPLFEAHIKALGLPRRFYEPVSVPVPPAHNPVTHYAARRRPSRDGSGRLVQGWDVIAKSVEEVQADLAALLADHRWQKETGGVTLPDGRVIQTTREAQAQVSSTFAALSAGLVQSVEWKAEGGWVSVTLAQFAPIAGLVVDHVRRCFVAERVVGGQIEAAKTLDDLAAIKLADAFAAAYAAA